MSVGYALVIAVCGCKGTTFLRHVQAELLFSVPVFGGGEACVGLEVLAEGELLGKAEFVRRLFDEHARPAQQILRLIDGDHVDPLHGRVVRLLPDDVREMTRREVLLCGVILHRAVLFVLLVQRQEERREYLPFVRRRGVRVLQPAAEQERVLEYRRLLE